MRKGLHPHLHVGVRKAWRIKLCITLCINCGKGSEMPVIPVVRHKLRRPVQGVAQLYETRITPVTHTSLANDLTYCYSWLYK